MTLKPVSVIDFDKKDCDLVTCPRCQQPTSFSLFVMTQKKNEYQHVQCIFCGTSYCLEAAPAGHVPTGVGFTG